MDGSFSNYKQESVQKYLNTKFGQALDVVRKTLQELAGSYSEEDFNKMDFDFMKNFARKFRKARRVGALKGYWI